jgi:hypothetical protein
MRINSIKATAAATKPKFRINIRRRAPTSPFTTLVQEAIQVSERLNAAYSGRLSGEACLREAIALAKCSPKQLAELREALTDGRPGLDHSRASVARIKRELLYTRRLNTIPSDAGQLLSRLRYYCRGAAEELVSFKGSILSLLCVAIAEATEERGAALFGTADSSADLKENVAELRARQKGLFDKILSTMTADDWEIGEADQNHNAPVSFKIAPAVRVYPKEDAGRRLVEYLMSRRKTA